MSIACDCELNKNDIIGDLAKIKLRNSGTSQFPLVDEEENTGMPEEGEEQSTE
jgi:hypothetical protein